MGSSTSSAASSTAKAATAAAVARTTGASTSAASHTATTVAAAAAATSPGAVTSNASTAAAVEAPIQADNASTGGGAGGGAGAGGDGGASPDTNAGTTTTTQEWFKVNHVRQLGNWDCGLASTGMILRSHPSTKGTLPFDDTSPATLAERIGIKSVWTIDLQHLLADFGVPSTFYTITVGVDASLGDVAYYASTFAADAARVNTLFAKAETRGLPVVKKSVSSEWLIEQLTARRSVFIVLVDLQYLRCSRCTAKNMEAMLRTSYEGHYVVLSRYDSDTQEFVYSDPNTSQRYCYSSVEDFDKARQAHGTDEDVLEVNLEFAPLNTT